MRLAQVAKDVSMVLIGAAIALVAMALIRPLDGPMWFHGPLELAPSVSAPMSVSDDDGQMFNDDAPLDPSQAQFRDESPVTEVGIGVQCGMRWMDC